MTDKNIPENTIEPVDNSLESNTLKLDERAKEFDDEKLEKIKLSNREIRHRVYMRWGSVILAILVIFGMSFVLWNYLNYQEFLRGLPTTISNGAIIALIGGPIASITAISVAFLVGAFRNQENKETNDTDQNLATSIATGATNITGGG